MNIGQEQKLEFINAAAAVIAWFNSSKIGDKEKYNSSYDDFIKDIPFIAGAYRDDFKRTYRILMEKFQNDLNGGVMSAIIYIEALKFNKDLPKELLYLINQYHLSHDLKYKVTIKTVTKIKKVLNFGQSEEPKY
jgi:hypothetical protein